MSVQEKYQTLLEMANQNGTTYNLSEADGVLHVDGTAPTRKLNSSFGMNTTVSIRITSRAI